MYLYIYRGIYTSVEIALNICYLYTYIAVFMYFYILTYSYMQVYLY